MVLRKSLIPVVALVVLAGCANAEGTAESPFVTQKKDNSLWVLRPGTKELEQFKKHGELVKVVTRIKAGPGGITVKAPDAETIDAYVYGKPGFHAEIKDNRLWVLRPGTKELEQFKKHGELVKVVTRIKAGPGGITVKAPDAETIDSYVYGKPGFHAEIKDNRLWVLRPGSKELDQFKKHGELVKVVTRIKAGPGGITVKAPDTETIDGYIYGKPGFHTEIKDNRLWVLRPGSKELDQFKKHGELVKVVTRIKAGPGGITVKAPDAETIDSYVYD